MILSNLHAVQFFALILLGILGFNVSHLVNEFGRNDSHIPPWITFILSVFSTVLITIIGFQLNANISTSLVEPDLLIFSGVGYIYTLITLQIIASNVFKWVGFSLISALCAVPIIMYSLFMPFFTLENLLPRIFLTSIAILTPIQYFREFKSKKLSTFLHLLSYFSFTMILLISWNLIPFDDFLPLASTKISASKINSSTEFALNSEMGADYSKLKELLSKKEFKAADAESRTSVSRSIPNMNKDRYESYRKMFSDRKSVV